MKTLQLLLILIFPFALPGQTAAHRTKLLAKNDSIGILIIRTGDASTTKYYVVYNQIDSILLHAMNREFYNDPSIYEGFTIDKPVQLDNAGKKEIKIYYVLNGAPGKGENNKTVFIINLNTKQKIFEGKYDYNDTDRKIQFGYTITFDSDGNLEIDYNKYTCSAIPEQKEGIYSLVDGKYKWIRSKYVYSRKTIARDDSSGIHITAISRCENDLMKYFLFYNNDADSIQFLQYYTCAEKSASSYTEDCKIKFMQLDKKGRPEIILEYSSSSNSSSSKETIIFNIDAGEIIFRADNNFFSMFEGEAIAKCKGYSSGIQILDSGNIKVTHPSENCMKPSVNEGTYVIENGKYVWVKTK
jgi:hypothetical protein